MKIFTATAIGLVLGLPLAAQAATVEIRSAVSAVQLGDTFDVELVFDRDAGDAPLAEFGIDVDYDNSLFSFVGGSFSNSLGDIAGTNDIADQTGFLQLLVSSTTDESTLDTLQQSAFSFATLTFSADAVGTGSFDLDQSFAFFADANFAGIPVTYGQTSTDVTVLAPIPLPASALLLLAGLGGLAAIRRRA
ncbi:VPLPA-CTERM sorting domain-containing protein [Jannaschia sp. LMIT008]|uniref:VPLPA-CTERM sorting domain-containing protein n=1 Tax=Jannaschia maritima TaxID=3032585 RepID=UPI002811E439|nr:VPLPA-CTERM sorting domain-containing protein [Jannaschia sp. LMIT008]